MWFESDEQRAEFEKHLAEKAGFDLEDLRSARNRFAKLPVGRLIKIWFGKVDHTDEFPDILLVLRKHLPTRASLFSWVYGPGHSIARDLQYVKLPSSEKRRLVNLVLFASRSRYPWLTSRLIHAMAFRPRAFDKMRSPNEVLEAWGPLYQRAVIPKGRGNRYLWIPNPPLKRVQKTLLHLIGPELERQLLPCVFGASAGREAPTFRNAATHLGKQYIASFDIRDFFPSTRIADIFAGIHFLRNKSRIMVDPSSLPHYLARSEQATELGWTDDAATLIARLATRRSRLPQGSPLSPLLANVAFAPYDVAMIQSLTQEFGRHGFRYTRYFDDLTISLTQNAASNRRLSTPQQVKLRCEELIGEVLRKSHYQLQGQKSRCSLSAHGHNVTGMVVYRDRVDLPRKLKRHLRSIVHHLNEGDFVAVSRKWYSGRNVLPPQFQSITRGHRWQDDGLRRRRISAERLATLMLRHFYPDLKLHRLLKDWHPWQEVFDRDDGLIEGHAAWKMVEWLLAALWCGNISLPPDPTNDNEIIFQQGGEDVCKLTAESSFGFFNLQRDWAIAVTEYWHHLRGLSGFLQACPKGPEFNGIHEWRDRLRDAIQAISIEIVAEIPPAPSPVPLAQFADAPDTTTGRIEALTRQVSNDYHEFASRIGHPADGQLAGHLQQFREVVHDKESYDKWISDTAKVFVHSLPLCLLPPGVTPEDVPVSCDDFFEYLRIKNDQLRELVHPHYSLIARVENCAALSRGDTDHAYRMAQHKVLKWIVEYFNVTTARRHELEGSEEQWREELATNLWCNSLEAQLENQFNQLEELHQRHETDDSETRLFVRPTGQDLDETRTLMRTTFDNGWPSGRCWDEFGLVCKKIYGNIFESIVPDRCTEIPNEEENVADVVFWKKKQIWKALLPPAGSEIRKRLKLIEAMRNREAHIGENNRRSEWVWIQRRVRDILGRSWDSQTGPNHPTYDAPDDLELKPYEATIVKLVLLRNVTEWLRTLPDD